MSVSGTPRRATIDGVTYNVAADANFAQTPPVTTEGTRHTGGTMMKRTLEVGQVESMTLILTSGQNASLEKSAKRNDNYGLSYELASGDVYRAVGMINLDNRETEENRRDITMIPDGDWRPFLVE